MKWTDAAAQGAGALIAKMREFYQVDENVSAEDGRALVGVLCEVRIRSLDILRSSYVFAQDVDIDFISTVKEQGLVLSLIHIWRWRPPRTCAASSRSIWKRPPS